MTMNEKITYGHRHLGFWFKPLLTISDENFEYHSKKYNWDEILKVKRYDSFMWAFFFNRMLGTPLSYIYLKDGSKIIIRGRSLEKSGVKPKVSFLRGVSNSYDELMGILQEKIRLTNTYTRSLRSG